MNPYKKTEHDVRAIVLRLWPESAADKIEATPTKDAAHGEIATNAAMVIAAQAKKNPKELAAQLLPELKSLVYVASAEIAGPGFINLTLKPEIWQEQLPQIIEQGAKYGDSKIGEGQKVNVEYVSVNPTGPMHVGHARYIYGDALANLLLKAGYGVTKEYYINDAGAQVDKVADSVFLRYREACGETIGEIPEGLYPGDYLIPVGEGLKKTCGTSLLNKPREEWMPHVRTYALEAMMALIKDDLAAIGIHHEIFTSEQAIRDAGKVDEAIAALERKGLIYTGVLEPPKGKTPDDWESRPQMLFRSTQFGDDIDRPVKKSDGSWTYFAPDIAYQLDKIQRGFTKLVMLLGVDHGGYVKRLKAAVTALSDGKVDLEIKLCQLVKFMRAGQPLKMSKRAGTFITVREVVDEVGKDVFRFIMLTRKNDVPLDFDFEKVMEQSKDNPVFYVQYAHARACSVMRKAAEEMPGLPSPSPLVGEGGRGGNSPQSLSSNVSHQPPLPNPPPQGGREILARLSHPAEMALIRLMCAWPRMVEAAALSLEPHRVAFYLHDLAAAFHGLWTLGNDDLGLRFIVKDDIELTTARMILAKALTKVIASGLGILGVEPLEEMR